MSLRLGFEQDRPRLIYEFEDGSLDANTLQLISTNFSRTHNLTHVSELVAMRPVGTPIFVLTQDGWIILEPNHERTNLRILDLGNFVETVYDMNDIDDDVAFNQIFNQTILYTSYLSLIDAESSIRYSTTNYDNVLDLLSHARALSQVTNALQLHRHNIPSLKGERLSIQTTSANVRPMTALDLDAHHRNMSRQTDFNTQQGISTVGNIHPHLMRRQVVPAPTPEDLINMFADMLPNGEGPLTQIDLVAHHSGAHRSRNDQVSSRVRRRLNFDNMDTPVEDQSNSPVKDSLFQQSYETLIKRLYGLPVELPKELVVNQIRMQFISFNKLEEIVKKDRGISRFYIEPMLQVWAGPPGTSNRIVTLFMNNGKSYLIKAQYNEKNNRLNPPQD